VLSLAVSAHLFPRLEAQRYGAGRMTKVRAQAVSRRSCAAVARRLGVPERLTAAAPDAVGGELAGTRSVLAEALEAVIGACYLTFGFERTAAAVTDAFAHEIEHALVVSVDFKSELQERLARRAQLVTYTVVGESGPPHERTFEVVAMVGSKEAGRGVGASKKDAEQAAARAALADGKE